MSNGMKASRNPVALVTGGTAGIGLEACKQLAAEGVDVIFTSRSEEKAKVVMKEIQNYAAPGVNTEYCLMEMSSLSSVKQGCSALSGKKIDYLLLNAGTMSSDNKKLEFSEAAIEITSAVNHVAGFLIAHEVLPIMERTAKEFPIIDDGSKTVTPMITFVSSDLHNIHSVTGAAKKVGPIVKDETVRFLASSHIKGVDGSAARELPQKDPLYLEHDARWSYKFSKLLNVLSARAIHERLLNKGSPVKCNSMEPGFIPESDFFRGARAAVGETVSRIFLWLVYNGPTNWIVTYMFGQPVRTVVEGGQSEVFALTKGESEKYYRLDIVEPPSPLANENEVVNAFYEATRALLSEKGYPVQAL